MPIQMLYTLSTPDLIKVLTALEAAKQPRERPGYREKFVNGPAIPPPDADRIIADLQNQFGNLLIKVKAAYK